MLRVLLLVGIFSATSTLTVSAEAKGSKKSSKKNSWGQWHQTHGVDKFPCMNEKETEYFKRWITVPHNDENKKIMADHRKQVKPGSRMPASLTSESVISKRFVCPPFRGVRNPHPEVLDFGKAAKFEHIKITESNMQILQGTSRGEKWPLQYNSEKGFFEGQTASGTPINVIPLVPPPGEKIRFLVQYLIWQDKTPPMLTLCYREDLHNQCNPYTEPAKVPTPAQQQRMPATQPPTPKSKG